MRLRPPPLFYISRYVQIAKSKLSRNKMKMIMSLSLKVHSKRWRLHLKFLKNFEMRLAFRIFLENHSTLLASSQDLEFSASKIFEWLLWRSVIRIKSLLIMCNFATQNASKIVSFSIYTIRKPKKEGDSSEICIVRKSSTTWGPSLLRVLWRWHLGWLLICRRIEG